MARGRAANGSGMQPRKRKDGLWECRYTVGTDPASGKPIRRSVYGKTSEEVAQKLRAATAAIDDGSYQELQKMRLKEWLAIWQEEYTTGIKDSTRKVYADNVRLHIVPALGMIRLCDLSPHDVQRFLNELQRGEKPLSAKTVKNIHGTLCKALGEAQRVKYLSGNPASGAILPKVKRREIMYFEPEEIQTFTAAAAGNPSEAVFFLALNTGLRLSEILGLRWSRVDFEASTITVDAQLLIARGKGSARVLGAPKNSEKRRFKVAPSVVNCLRSIQRQQREWRLKAGEVWCNDDGLVFTDEVGRSISHKTIEDRFRAIMSKAGLTGRTFHSLRHTFAIEAIRAGVDVKTVSEMLGHASVAFTLDVYADMTKAMQNQAANLLEAWIKQRESIPR